MTARKKIPSRAALIQALRENDGNMSAAARRFHCDRTRVWQIVNADPELRELTDQLAETFIDEAENKLFEAIRAGNVVATIFFLKTRAKHRGYSERLELIPLDRRDIEVELGQPIITNENHNLEALDRDRPAIALLEQ
jgi:hypothetical protein